MNVRAWAVVGVVLAAFALPVHAQDYRYHLYVDRDVNASTGCTINYPLGAVAGAEMRISANVTGTTVTSVTTAQCSSGSFGPPTNTGGPHPVGLNNGTAGADVIELAADRGLFGTTGVVRVMLASENGAATSNDLLLNLQPSGGPILLALSNTPIPIFGGLGLLLLVGALLFIASRRLKLGVATLGALMMAGAVWAANFAVDGAVGDWTGVAPLATDPTGDGSGPDVGADIVALFAAEENGRVYARVDVVDVENQAPVAASQAQTYLEDAPAQTITLTATDADGDPLTFAIQTTPTRGVLGPIVPINATSASVTYTPNANEFGADSFTFVANDGLVNSLPATVGITLTPVNDVPSFTSGGNVTVLKDSGPQTINPWATAISVGPANEAGQTLAFTIATNDNSALFSVQPAVSPTGVLTFTPALNANGIANLSVFVQDNGGVANGGVDTSAAQNFSITLTAVNDAPSFTAGPNQTVNEDAGAQTVNPWATAISAGPPDESGQTLTFNVTNNTNPALFSAGPAVSPTGVLTYTPAADAFGVATITLTLSDNGGTANGGVDTSAPQTFTITVNSVNDAPSFIAVTPITVLEDSGAQTATVANAISAGPANESGQTLAFLVNVTNPALFNGAVTVSPAGVMSFTPATNASGSTTIDLRLQDNGGTANGGVDTSAIQTITVNITAVDDAPVAAAVTSTFAEDTPQSIALSYTDVEGDLATACTLSALVNVTESTPCACAAGVCSVGVTGSPLHYNGAASFSYTVTALQPSNSAASTLTITAVNDAPVNTVPGAQTTGVGVALALSTANGNALSIVDVDSAAGAISTTISTTLGTFSATAQNGATVTGSGTASVTISDIVGDVNATLQTLSFVSAGGGSATVTMATTDNGNTGSGGAQLDSDMFTINVDAAPTVTTNPANGGSGIAVNSNITVTFNESVTLTGAWFTLNCASSGVRTSTGELAGTGITIIENTPDLVYTVDPTVNFASGETCTVTIDSANAVDNDVIDPPNELDGNASGDSVDGDADDHVASFSVVDVAPTATPVTASGSTIANNAAITINFSENVNIAAGAITWACAPGFTPALPQNNVNTITLTPTGTLPSGACNVTLESTLITDADAVDPPNELDGNASGDVVDGDADDQVINYTVDAAPTVTAVSPLDNATGVAIGTNVDVTFSEAVTVNGSWFQIVCPISGTRTTANTVVSGGPTTFTINPNVDFSPGENCVLTVFGAQIDDNDAFDPPTGLAADFVSDFTTVDLPPTATPVTASGSTIANNATLTINFSENVNIAAGAITWACAPGFTPALPQNNVNSITLTPTATLPNGAACNVTLESTLITDVDAVDPPNELDGNASGDTSDGDADDQVIVYTVDAAPAFVSSTPANNDMSVAANTNILVNFSEAVNVSVVSFTIGCGGPNLGYAISGSGTAAITLDPTLDLPGGTVCTVTAVPASIDDSDAIDPPANPAPFNFSFTTAFVANDDAYPVTQHLTLNAPAAAETDANDQLGVSGVITGFGTTLGTANGTAPGTRLDDGANGSLLLNANGTFTFFPPAVPTAATTDFFYTVTGGDTASITFTYQSEMVWFVDNTPTAPVCTGSNVGTQSCPAATTGAITGVDTANDTIFVASGTYTGQTALEAGERLIGDGSTSTLQAITAITPVTGSSFAPYATFSGVAPVLSTGSLTDCVVLGTGNTIRGVTIANCGGAAGDSSDINGNGFGTLTVAETTLNGTGRALSLTNGTLAGSFIGVSTSAATGDGLTLATVGGAMNFGPTSITGVGAAGIGVNINPSSAALTFGGLTVTKTTAGTGVNINASTGAITTGALAITTSNGTGLTFDNSGGALTIASGSISATGGPAINSSSSANWNATLATVTSTNSASQGINLNGIGGTLTMNGGSITGATGTAFFGQGTLGTTTYAGTITKGNAGKIVVLSGAGATTSVTLSGNLTCNTGCTGLDVLNRSAGTYTFSGASKVLNTGTSAAVTLTNNAGATINFIGGGLDIDTTAGASFVATGPGPAAASGGTVSVQGAGNSLTSATGVALQVSNTTIAASGVVFQSISANGASNGIILNNTGSSGGLMILGTGVADSGGVIQNVMSDGISATNTMNLQISDLRISSPGLHGINATNLRGACSLENSTIENWSNAGGNAYSVVNNGSAALALLTITGSTFNGSNTGNDGLFMEAQGSGALSLLIESSIFTDIFGDGVQVSGITGSTSTVNVTIRNSTFSNAAVLGNGGISLQIFGGISFTGLVEDNTLDTIMRPVTNLGAIGGTNGLTATANITVRGNVLNNIVGARGITFAADGSGLNTLSIENNSIDRLGSTSKYAIQINMIGTALISSTADVTIRDNQIGQADSLWTSGNGTAEAIHLLTQNGSTMRSLLSNNVIDANASLEVVRARAIGSSRQDVTYINNDVNDTVGTHVGELAVRSEGTATLCTNINGNALPLAGVGVILLSEGTGSISVTQASSASLSAANSSATVTTVGTPSFGGAACSTPP
jgi:methionine-rich copper-binding protein CopC